MRKFTISCAAVALLTAACGGDTTSTTTPTEPTSTSTSTFAATTTTVAVPMVFESDDGRVSIEVPTDALPGGDPGIVIAALGPDEQPVELGDLDVKPWVYRLEPERLEFDTPVTVTMRVPFDEFASEGFDGATPLATLITTTLDGSGWELLDDLSISRDGDLVFLSGTTDHFSRLAAIPEQVFIETRFLEVASDATSSFGLDFTWSNGSPLQRPDLEGVLFQPAGESDRVTADPSDSGFALTCPPQLGAASTGELDVGLILGAVSASDGVTGLVSTPLLTSTGTDVAKIAIRSELRLVCRPTISDGDSIEITIDVDHPGGLETIAGGDFRGGLSGERVTLPGEFPGLYGGLVADSNNNGVLDGDDLMYPPFQGDVLGGATVFVLPLFGFGDYFLYFLDLPASAPRPIETAVTVRDGGTVLLGGLLQPEQTSVPFLSDVPLISRVFSDETTTTEKTELVIFLTPRIVEGSEE